MNWEAVSAVGEVVGLLVIIVSLTYVAVQIKQSNNHAMASSEIDWMAAMNQILNSWVNDERTISAIQKGFENFSDLSNAEKAIFHMRVGALANHWFLAKQLQSKGLLSEDYLDEMTKLVVAVLATPGGLDYWEHDSKLSPNGGELLSLIKDSQGKYPNWIELLPWWGVEKK